MKNIKSFRCSYEGWHQIVHSTTVGKAKSQFSRRTRIPFLKIKATSVKTEETTDFLRIARYRGVPNAKIGSLVQVDRRTGRIVGVNDSCNFDVEFENGSVFNCHPNWKMIFIDEAIAP